MKAVIYTEYGRAADVLRLAEIEKPVPKDDEVLIKIRAAGLNALDWRLMCGKPMFMRLMVGGLRKPKTTRPGVDVAGQVEAVGKSVTQFKPGDAVFGVCDGACAEYVCTREAKLVLKSANISFEEAAAVPVAAVTALQGLRDKGRIQRGQKVLIVGASGGVGTFAIQIAKVFGAEVTAVCSTRNVEQARSIGADHVIDYTKEDFTRNGQRYDIIYAANSHRSVFDYRPSLGPNGIFVMAGGGLPQIFQTMLLAWPLSIGRKKVRFIMTRTKKADFLLLKDMLEAGTIRSVIDRRYPLRDAAEGVGYVEEGHARGKVVISMSD
jgi:NADPH:quinone reductase-like Zn-dependent oxidoreductase